MSKTFNIVGGGISGLVVACELSRAGYAVTVYERRGLGGVVSSHELAGVSLDAGAESFATRTTAVKELLEDLGIADRIVEPLRKPSWVYADEHAYPSVPGVFGIPVGLDEIAEVLTVEGMWNARMDLIMGAKPGTEHSISIGDLVEKRMGKEVVEKLVSPVITGVHAASPYDLDADIVIPGIREKILEAGSLQQAVAKLREAAPAGQNILSLKGGMHVLTDTLLKQCTEQGVTFTSKNITSLEKLENPIVATELHDARTLLKPYVDIEENEKGANIALVTLIVKAEQLNTAPRGTGVLVDEHAQTVQAKALTHATAKWKWISEALPEYHAIRLSYGRPGTPPPGEADIVDIAIKDAQKLLDAEFEEIIAHDVVHWPQGIPFATVGHHQRMAELKEQLDTCNDVHAVGAWLAGTGLASVVLQAREVAQKILAQYL